MTDETTSPCALLVVRRNAYRHRRTEHALRADKCVERELCVVKGPDAIDENRTRRPRVRHAENVAGSCTRAPDNPYNLQ